MNAPAPPAIEMAAVSKHFDSVIAVDRLSFRVSVGKVCALLGGNGAGKTTTIGMLLGLLTPSAGLIRVFGVDIKRRRYQVLPRMNFSSPYVDLPHRLTVAENLNVYAHLYGISRRRQRLAEVAEELELGAFWKRRYGTLSAGQKTRVALAKALLNRPDLLLLDEPTASLDPDSADRMRRMLSAYQRSSGATLLLASHNMGEVERLCDQVIVMRAGAIADEDTPQALLQRYGRSTLEHVFLDIARGTRAETHEYD